MLVTWSTQRSDTTEATGLVAQDSLSALDDNDRRYRRERVDVEPGVARRQPAGGRVEPAGRDQLVEKLFGGASDLLLLVTTGRPPKGEGKEADEQAMLTVAQYLALDFLGGLWGEGDVESVAESFFDRFEFETGRNVSRTGRETWEVRFRLADAVLFEDDRIVLTGEQDEFEHYNAGVRLVIHGQ